MMSVSCGCDDDSSEPRLDVCCCASVVCRVTWSRRSNAPLLPLLPAAACHPVNAFVLVKMVRPTTQKATRTRRALKARELANRSVSSAFILPGALMDAGGENIEDIKERFRRKEKRGKQSDG